MTRILRFLELSPLHLDAASRAMFEEAAGDTLFYMQQAGRLPKGVQLNFGPADESSGAAAFPAYPGQWGWVCYAHDAPALLDEAGVTEPIKRIFRYARLRDCDYVIFDEEAHLSDEYDVDLPVFDENGEEYASYQEYEAAN